MSRNFTLTSEEPTCGKKESLTIAVMGNQGVGKSTLVCRLLKHWNELRRSKKKKNTFNIYGKDLNVNLVNTSPDFTMDAHHPKSDVFVLVYSIVDGDSFQSACNARDHILATAERDVPIIFVANKTDIAGSVEVMIRCSRNFMITDGMNHSHFEVSAETDSSALDILKEILNKSMFCGVELNKTEEIGKGRKKVVAKSSSVIEGERKKFKKKKWTQFRRILSALKV